MNREGNTSKRLWPSLSHCLCIPLKKNEKAMERSVVILQLTARDSKLRPPEYEAGMLNSTPKHSDVFTTDLSQSTCR
jgi:hypothetical protein